MLKSMCVSKETYLYGKRDLFIWQKRPADKTYRIEMLKSMCVSKENGKRDLFIWQKRPIHMTKETYSYGKRDLFI